MKKIKLLMVILVIILMLLIIAYFLVGNYFYNIALNPNSSKTFVLGEDEEQTEEEKSIALENVNWLESKSANVFIKSNNDGLQLHAYEITNENSSNIWTIVVHGYMSQGKSMIYQAKQFYDRGYNVLIVDLRGHGQSQGNYIGMGWPDRLDIIDWTNYIINKDNDSKIILYGVSMGAATVMMATGEELPSNKKLAIEDCGYTSIWDEFKMQLKDLFNLPEFPVLNAANTVCKIRAGYGIDEGSSIEQLKKSKTPTLFIHGDKDTFVPFEMLDRVYNVATCEKEKLVIGGAEHAEAAYINPQLYWSKIDNFINKHISNE